jgi:hypothetical protein
MNPPDINTYIILIKGVKSNMKKKIIGLFVCILLIVTVVPSVEPLKSTKMTPMTSNGIPQFYSRGNWTEEEKLLASDGQEGDNFGCYVSLSGDTALVGAWLDGDNGYHSGSAYVFIRNGTTWVQQAKLLPSDGKEEDLFGWSVSLDNDTALIGAYWDDENGDKSGSAYVFTRIGTTWAQQAKLFTLDGATMDYFGYSVSLSGDTALISAPLDDVNGDASGSAYIFTRTGTTWTQQAKLIAADGAIGDNFGIRVFLAGDTALIGASADDDVRGSAYVFTRTSNTWTQQAKLLASDGQSDDFFGWFVSLSDDTALIGAPGDSDYGDSSGSAYVFTRTGTTWTQQQKLLPSDGYTWDYFGYAVTLSGDTAIVSAPQDDDKGEDSGSAYVFTRTDTTWTQQHKLLASDGQAGDTFGWWSVCLNDDSAIISSCRDDDNGLDSGSAYVFTKGSENQPPTADFSWTPQNPNPNQQVIFDASASHDPDGAITLYEWDWDNDGISDEASSNPTIIHSWTHAGNYPVTVRVTDDENAADTMTKTIHVNEEVPHLIIEDFNGGIGIRAIVTNTGNGTATNITWSMDLQGKMIFHGTHWTGNISSLSLGDTAKIQTGLILGFGKITIVATATCAEGVTDTEDRTAFVLLFFVVGISEPLS